MEPQFELQYELKKEHYVQLYKYLTRKRFVSFGVIGGLGLLFLAWGLWTMSIIPIVGGLLELGIAVNVLLRPCLIAKKSVARAKKYDGSQVLLGRTVFADAVMDISPKQTVTISYDRFKTLLVSGKLLALIDVKNDSLMMDVDGFTKGNFFEFLTFIQEKCPQIELIYR